MVALTPAALASPPDQHWLAGLYDNADYDDVVLAVVESVALKLQPSHNLQFGQSVVSVMLSPDESLRATPRPSSSPIRAPPTS
jgi:hypothetical protein